MTFSEYVSELSSQYFFCQVSIHHQENLCVFEPKENPLLLRMGLLDLKKPLGLRRLLEAERACHRIRHCPDISIGIAVPNVDRETFVLRSPESHSSRIGKRPPYRRISRYPETICGRNTGNAPESKSSSGVGIFTKHSVAWNIACVSGEERWSKKRPTKHR